MDPRDRTCAGGFVPLPQLTCDPSQVSDPRGGFRGERRGENQHLSGGGLCGREAPGAASKQVCHLGEQSRRAERSKTEQRAGRMDFSAESN